MDFIPIWLLLSVGVGFLAKSRYRSLGAWIAISVVASPLLAFIVLMVIDKGEPTDPVTGVRLSVNHVRCPDCRELIRRDASKCKHCGSLVAPQ